MNKPIQKIPQRYDAQYGFETSDKGEFILLSSHQELLQGLLKTLLKNYSVFDQDILKGDKVAHHNDIKQAFKNVGIE